MKDKYGVIFIDKEEVIIQIYEKITKGEFTKLYNKQYDFATFSSKKSITAGEIIEIIAQTAISREAINVSDWRLCSREVPDGIISQISYATNIKAESLTLTREQNLICQGIISEF